MSTELAEKSLTNILQKISSETFQEIAHLCLDELCGRRGPQYETFQKKSNCSPEDFLFVVSNVKTVLLKIVGQDTTNSQDVCNAWTDVEKSYQECLLKSLQSRPKDVQILHTHISSTTTEPALKDFDWNLKWVMGSSSLASLEQPLVSLDLQLTNGNVQTLEMDQQEIDKLINSLEQSCSSSTIPR